MVMFSPQPALNQPVNAIFNEKTRDPVDITVSWNADTDDHEEGS